MANIAISHTDTNVTKIVFRNMTLDNARKIADHMNTLNRLTAKRTSKVLKLFFKVIGE